MYNAVMFFTIIGIAIVFIVPVSAQDCQNSEIGACLEPMLEVYQDLTTSLVTGEINLADLTDICPLYLRYAECVSPKCLIPLFQEVHQTVVEVFSYICDDAFNDIRRYRSCWTNPVLQSEYFECGTSAAQITIANRDPCQFFVEIEACLDDVTRARCDADPVRLIRGFLNVAYTRQTFDLQCKIGTPVLPVKEPVKREGQDVPAEPVRCWECNSGAPRHSNPSCPINGNLVTDRLTSVECKDACFVRWNENIIHRGCSTGHYLPEVERTGCIENDEGVVWCFCSRDRCNGQDMSMFVNRLQ